MSRFLKGLQPLLGLVLAIFMVLNTTPYNSQGGSYRFDGGIESNNVEGKTVDGRFVEFSIKLSSEMFKRSFDDENICWFASLHHAGTLHDCKRC